MMPNCPQYLIGLLGTWKAGAIAVPFSPLWAEPEVRPTLTDCGAETALALTPFYARMKAAQPGTPLQRVIATTIKEHLPPHVRLLFTAFKEAKEGHRIALQAGDLWLGDLLAEHRGAARPDVSVGPDDVALFIYTGGRIVEGYSLTEAMVAAVITPVLGTYKPRAVGVPVPDVELRITGDLAYLDEDGYLFQVGRKKEVIKPGGKQVWPGEVEEAIASHPAVAEVGVGSVPDERLGEAINAWVVRRPGETATVDELRTQCKQLLAPYKVPKRIEFRDSLPKSAGGKVLRRELARGEAKEWF